MYLASSAHIKQLDNLASGEYGIPVDVLMENAGKAVYDRICETFQENEFAVFCGKGNNGGDGLVIARLLKERGADVKVYLTDEPLNFSDTAKQAYDKAVESGVVFVDFDAEVSRNAIIIDALLGISLSGAPKGNVKEAIDKISMLKNKIISVDIPSGLSADSGKIYGSVVKADYTYTLAIDKVGLNVYPGAGVCGIKEVLDIGIPIDVVKQLKFKNHLTDIQTAEALLIKRKQDGHKGDFGKVGIIGGSAGMAGSVCMAAKSALRSGAGLVYVFVPDEIINIVSIKLTEAIVLKESEISNYLDKLDAIAIGMGYSQNGRIKHIMKMVMQKFTKPVVIDADGINFLASNIELLKSKKCPAVLTPHPGEFSRLIKMDIEEVNSNRIFLATKYANELNSVILLKGAGTVVSSIEGTVRINSTGNSGMATAGSGDVLSGIIAAFLAQGMNTFDSASIGAYIHGLSGDIVKKDKTEYGIIASDITDNLPSAFKKILREV